jgi:hypothetical protein
MSKQKEKRDWMKVEMKRRSNITVSNITNSKRRGKETERQSERNR